MSFFVVSLGRWDQRLPSVPSTPKAKRLWENMPENSVSKSGVCKGPKYFSYKGVTLYKLKNSFLKNKE